MEDAKTWREFLGVIISDPREKQRISREADINPVTLTRWIKHRSNPRSDNLRPLLDVLPQYRQQLGELIAKEFPQFFNASMMQEEKLEIPSRFYTRVLATYTTSLPLLRQDLISTLIIQQMLDQLDPQPEDLGILLSLCVKPEPGKKVRSLCRVMGKASHYHGNDLQSQIQFLGSESQSGHALMRKYPIVTQTMTDYRRLFPHQIMGLEESTAAFPILLADQTAGVLTLGSTQQGFFTQVQEDLIQGYINLLALAFAPEDFYALDMIELGIMPPRSIQTPYIANFQQRVTQYMITQCDRSLTRPEAEIIVKREVETELLRLEY